MLLEHGLKHLPEHCRLSPGTGPSGETTAPPWAEPAVGPRNSGPALLRAPLPPPSLAFFVPLRTYRFLSPPKSNPIPHAEAHLFVWRPRLYQEERGGICRNKRSPRSRRVWPHSLFFPRRQSPEEGRDQGGCVAGLHEPPGAPGDLGFCLVTSFPRGFHPNVRDQGWLGFLDNEKREGEREEG